MIKTGSITCNDLVWYEGKDDWRELKEDAIYAQIQPNQVVEALEATAPPLKKKNALGVVVVLLHLFFLQVEKWELRHNETLFYGRNWI